MKYITIDKTRCPGRENCPSCPVEEDMHDHISFHGVLMVSNPKWAGKEGDNIRDAIRLCNMGAVSSG